MGRPRVISDETIQAMLAAGKTNSEISAVSGVAERTVRERIAKLRKTHAGSTALAARKAMNKERTQLEKVLAAIPEDPTPEYLHTMAARALAMAVAMNPGSRESLAAAQIIKDKVPLPERVEAPPTEDLIAIAMEASRTAIKAARIDSDKGAIDATAVEKAPEEPKAKVLQ